MDMQALKPSLLQEEIGRVINKINHFDNLRHRTKQMVITLWLAVIGVGVGVAGNLPDGFILFAIAIPLPFWYLDATYHAYQEGYNFRWRAIRSFLNERWYHFRDIRGNICTNPDLLEFPIPDDYGSQTPWVDETLHKKVTSLTRNAFTWKMLVFYGFLCITPVIVWAVLLIVKPVNPS